MGKRLAVFLIVVMLAVTAWLVVKDRRPGLSRLRVVYAGDPDTAQTESFRKLLAEHVRNVTVIPVLNLAKADLSAADVLIVGGETIGTVKVVLGGGHMKPGPVGITLDTLSIPTVLIGAMGARIADNLDLKLGWRHG
jgi:hypothetical protein